MWHERITARQLREKFPDVALKLETEQLRNELKQLGLVFSQRFTSRSAYFEVELKPDHLLRLQPTDRTHGHVSEWMTWHENPNPDSQIPIYSLRVVATVTNRSNTFQTPYTMTIHDDGLEQVMRCVIANYKISTGIDITPKTKVRNK